MAGGRLGTVYVELDLDKDRYMRSQRTLLSEAQDGAKNLEKNFKNLGIKSGATYDLMRAQAQKSFEAIKNSSKTTSEDLIRAEKAKAEKIRQINEQQYGHQKTILSNLKNQWKALSVVAIAATTAAAYQMQKLGFEAIKAASDLEEVTSKFNTVFKGQQTQAEEWAKVLVDSYAMSTRESKQYLSSVQDLLVPMGMQAKAAARMSNEVVKLSADLGSFNNLPTAKVMDDIQSALVGNYETMKKYGVVLTATRVQERALSDGLEQTKEALTAADKAQTAYKLIVEGSTAAIGDMTRTSDSYANQTKKLEANIEDLKAMLGNELLPTATDIVSKMNEWIAANNEFINQKVSETVEDIGSALKTIVGIYQGLPDGVIGAAGIGIVGRILTGSTPIAQAAAAIVLLNTQLKAIGMNLGSIPEKSAGAWENIVNIWDVITGKRDWNTGESTRDTVAMADAIIDVNEALFETLPPLTVSEKKIVKLTASQKKHAEMVERLNRDYKTNIAYLDQLSLKDFSDIWDDAVSGPPLDEWVWASDHAIEEMTFDFEMYMADIENQTEETSDMVEELWTKAMNRVQESFADTFYDAMTGQFDDVGDAFESLLDDMLRMLAECAAAATMYDLFEIGDGSISWSKAGSVIGSIFGGSGSSGSGGGIMDWIGTIFSVGKSGYELYTGESLAGMAWDWASSAVAEIFGAASVDLVGSGAWSLSPEAYAAMTSAVESAAASGGSAAAGSAVGSSTGAIAGGAYAAVAMAVILGITEVFKNNMMKGDANMTVAFQTKISDVYDQLFDLEFLGVMFNKGFEESDAKTEAISLFNQVADTFTQFENIFSLLSEESQQSLKESMKKINWDEFILQIQAVATGEGEIQNIRGMIGDEGFADWIASGMPRSDAKPWTEGDNKYDDYWNQYIQGPYGDMDYFAKASTATDILWDVINEYFAPYLGEAISAITDFDVYQYMSDEFQASMESLGTEAGWANGVEAYFKTFGENIDKIYEASAAYQDFNDLIDGVVDEYTGADEAIDLAAAATQGYVDALEAAGQELSDEDIQAIATSWAQSYAAQSNGLNDVTEQATAADQAIAQFRGQFEATWKAMVDAGVDVEKLGDKTELFDEGVQNLLESLNDAAWDAINDSVKSLMSNIGSTESTVNSLIDTFTEMWVALVQVNAASEDFVALQEMALEAMKYQMGLGDGFDMAGQIAERYGTQWSYQEMIDAFATMDLDDLIALADKLDINWWDIASDVAWMMDNVEELGDAVTEAAWKFQAAADAIRANLDDIASRISGYGSSNSAGTMYSAIEALKSDVSAALAGGDMETAMGVLSMMSQSLGSWYTQAVSEAESAARDEEQALRDSYNAQKELLNEQLATAKAFGSLVDQIESVVQNIKYSSLNVALPSVKATVAKDEYNTLLETARQTGTVEDYQKFAQFAQTALSQYQERYKSSSTYQDFYAQVMADLEDARASAEAQSYEQAIINELESIDNSINAIDIAADLSGITQDFNDMALYINQMLDQLEKTDFLLNIDWDNYDGSMADALNDLQWLVEKYGWDNSFTLTYIADMAQWLAKKGDIQDMIDAMDYIAEASGSWLSTATLTFVASLAGNISDWKTGSSILEHLMAQQGITWDSRVIGTFLANLDPALTGMTSAEWLMKYLVTNTGGTWDPDIYANLKAKLVDSADMSTTINDWLTDLGITNANLQRQLEVQLLYQFEVSGDVNINAIAEWAWAKIIAALSSESIADQTALMTQVRNMGMLYGVNTAYGLGHEIAKYNLTDDLTTETQWAWAGNELAAHFARLGITFAEGGIVNSPTLGWVGEAGYPEAIIPMMDGTSIPVKWLNGGSTGRGDMDKRTINLTVQIAGKEFEGEVKSWADDVVVMRAKRGKLNDTRRQFR
jgi:hypothetical protein